MIVYRLSKALYGTDLSGKGAEVTGGRWNSKGVPMIYTSSSRALCTAEIAFHVPLGLIPSGYQLTTLSIPEVYNGEEPDLTILPSDWNSFPYKRETQQFGDAFIKNKITAKNSSVEKLNSCGFLVSHRLMSDEKQIF